MGQAKQRGSKDQRINEAIIRNAALKKARQEEYDKRMTELTKLGKVVHVANANGKRSGEKALATLAAMMGVAASLEYANLPKRTPRASPLKIGGFYNWKGQPERLVYLGYNFSGNGYWHQFAKTDTPHSVWCEVQPSDLAMIEETQC